MGASQLIGPTLSRPTPAPSTGTGFWRRPSRSLPADLVREASQRLGVISLVSGILWILANVAGHVAYHATYPADPRWIELRAADWISLAAAGASFALWFYARREHENPERVLEVGRAYMVAMAMGLGGAIYSEPPPADLPPVSLVSWAGAMVLMFAAIVPSPPLKTLTASLVAVSMTPLALVLAHQRGRWPSGSITEVVVMAYPDYLVVGAAVVISHVMTRLGQKVARAREMGSYQLGELLGRGGMGEVYKASHRMLARPAAIKLIRDDVIAAGDGETARLAVRRFRREAEAAARLTSPHTVALYDFGVTDDHTLFLVMELLEGKDLQTLVRDHGPMPPARAIYVLRQVCESLEEAHAAGLVHRDIKPANIHVGRVGTKFDYVKVLDFGLVKSTAGGGFDESLGTAAAITPGTPAYMPPEAALGTMVDGRSDIYSLGCVAYYLLTGRLVFEGDSPLQNIAKHLRSEPGPPSQRAPFRLPAALDRIVLACLAKRPEDRPQTAVDLARALAAVDVEPWTQAKAEAWWQAVAGDEAEPVSRRSVG
jgi:serine/threonine-protein kinase